MTKEKENPGFMEAIYRKHERLMYYIAGKYTTNLVQREDIVQTAVLALLKNEATLQRHMHKSTTLQWLSAIPQSMQSNETRRKPLVTSLWTIFLKTAAMRTFPEPK